MAKTWKSSRAPASSVEPSTVTECARRYHACAIALAKSLGLPMTAAFLQEYHSAISCVYIEAGRAGVRLAAGVQLPPLTAPAVEAPAEAGEIMCSGMPPAPEAPATNGHTPPVAIPTDSDLPCRGQLLVDLKPASLSMLLGKLKGLAETQGGRWTVLLQALQAERARRLERGRKSPRRPDPDPDPTGHVEVEGEVDVP